MSCARSHRRICRVPTTGLPPRRIRRASCSAPSIASMACPGASSRHAAIAAPTALSPTRAGLGFEPMTARTLLDLGHPGRACRMAGALIGVALSLGGCLHTEAETQASIPADYRLRHPIAVEEANQSIVVFVGRGRGGLTAEQRADVMGLAQSWMHDGTGAISADVPVDTPNARAAADSFREIQAMLAAAGVSPRGLVMRHYRPEDPKHMAAIRLGHPKMR